MGDWGACMELVKDMHLEQLLIRHTCLDWKARRTVLEIPTLKRERKRKKESE